MLCYVTHTHTHTYFFFTSILSLSQIVIYMKVETICYILRVWNSAWCTVGIQYLFLSNRFIEVLSIS